jgi:hypothetical protein
VTTLTTDCIRVRAYFHFENRTGRNWADPVSNWLQAEQEEHGYRFFEELGRRVGFIRSLYRRHKIALKPGEEFTLALDEAEALAKGIKSRSFSAEGLKQTVRSAHVIYALGDSLSICVDAGLDLRNHLANLTTGTTDYGTPSTDRKHIFFKDFEFETFIASVLIQNRLTPALTAPGDPTGELIFGDLFIECKHPNSVGQLARLLGKFNRGLAAINRFGIFAVALEDVMEMGDVAQFDSKHAYEGWLQAKRAGMEAIGQELIQRAARLPRIAALIQTETKDPIIGTGTTLRRLGNSLLFDHRPTFINYETTARAIAACFNPHPVLYSEI